MRISMFPWDFQAELNRPLMIFQVLSNARVRIDSIAFAPAEKCYSLGPICPIDQTLWKCYFTQSHPPSDPIQKTPRARGRQSSQVGARMWMSNSVLCLGWADFYYKALKKPREVRRIHQCIFPAKENSGRFITWLKFCNKLKRALSS